MVKIHKIKAKTATIAIWIGLILAIAFLWWVLIEFMWLCDSLGMKM